MNDKLVNNMWETYRKLNPKAPEAYDVWGFGNTPEMADELAELVVAGKKSATSSLYMMYQLEQEDLPYVGEHNIILNGSGEPVAILEAAAVDIVPFREVTAEHAYLEGEGDRSLAYWRKVHEDFFRQELEGTDQEFHEGLLVVCERYKLVYKK